MKTVKPDSLSLSLPLESVPDSALPLEAIQEPAMSFAQGSAIRFAIMELTALLENCQRGTLTETDPKSCELTLKALEQAFPEVFSE